MAVPRSQKATIQERYSAVQGSKRRSVENFPKPITILNMSTCPRSHRLLALPFGKLTAPIWTEAVPFSPNPVFRPCNGDFSLTWIGQFSDIGLARHGADGLRKAESTQGEVRLRAVKEEITVTGINIPQRP